MVNALDKDLGSGVVAYESHGNQHLRRMRHGFPPFRKERERMGQPRPVGSTQTKNKKDSPEPPKLSLSNPPG